MLFLYWEAHIKLHCFPDLISECSTLQCPLSSLNSSYRQLYTLEHLATEDSWLGTLWADSADIIVPISRVKNPKPKPKSTSKFLIQDTAILEKM